MCTGKCFSCLLLLQQNALLTVLPGHIFPQEIHVLIVRTSWDKAFTVFLVVSSTRLHSCAVLAASHLCRLTQEAIGPPVFSPDNMHSLCCSLGVYLANTATMLTTQRGVVLVTLHVFLWRMSLLYIIHTVYWEKRGN